MCSTPGLYPDTVLRYQPIEFDDCGFFGFNRLRRGIDNRRVRSPARLRLLRYLFATGRGIVDALPAPSTAILSSSSCASLPASGQAYGDERRKATEAPCAARLEGRQTNRRLDGPTRQSQPPPMGVALRRCQPRHRLIILSTRLRTVLARSPGERSRAAARRPARDSILLTCSPGISIVPSRSSNFAASASASRRI